MKKKERGEDESFDYVIVIRASVSRCLDTYVSSLSLSPLTLRNVTKADNLINSNEHMKKQKKKSESHFT